MKELVEVRSEQYGYRVSVEEDNIYIWCVVIQGPPDTPYEGGMFKVRKKS